MTADLSTMTAPQLFAEWKSTMGNISSMRQTAAHHHAIPAEVKKVREIADRLDGKCAEWKMNIHADGELMIGKTELIRILTTGGHTSAIGIKDPTEFKTILDYLFLKAYIIKQGYSYDQLENDTKGGGK